MKKDDGIDQSGDVSAARLRKLAKGTRLGPRPERILVEELGAPSLVTEVRLRELVERKQLDPEEARALGRTVSFFHLLDGRPELVETVASAAAAPDELVDRDEGWWSEKIRASGTTPPPGASRDEYARTLRARTRLEFPAAAIGKRLGAETTRKVLERAEPVEARREINRHVGLGLAGVLDDAKLAPPERVAEVERRVDVAARFFRANPRALAADLRPGSKAADVLTFPPEATPEDRKRVLAMGRAYQRVIRVSKDLDIAETVVAAGFPSSTAIAHTTPLAFATATGLDLATATRLHGEAVGVAGTVIGGLGTIIDVMRGGLGDTAVSNTPDTIPAYLKEIPGFADFFGNQDFCDCQHCQSILGPAAYFVDLMRFVEGNITTPVFGARRNHPLNLRSRRPDLWERLELTCANTNTEIPTLEVINEILEDAVARDSGYAGDLRAREAVRTAVYGQALLSQVHSFTQPFHLPVEELKIYLGHFSRSLADLAEAARAEPVALARLRLGLSPDDWQLIVTQNVGMPFLRRIYRLPIPLVAGVVEPVDAQDLLAPMGVDRDELGELLATPSVRGGAGDPPIRITAEKRDPASVQNDVEYVRNLTPASLDRLHRFVRLWRATGWRIGELDLARSHLEVVGLATSIAQTSRELARVHRLAAVVDVELEELLALFSPIPERAAVRDAKAAAGGDPRSGTVYPPRPSSLRRRTVPLLDRLFNEPRFVAAGGGYPQPNRTFLHPTLAVAPPAAVHPELHRLLGGLGVDEDQLHQLIVGLALPLGVSLDAPADAARSFSLSLRNLTLLYRHARLGRLLKLGLPELFALIAMTPGLTSGHVETLDDLEAVLAAHRWWKSTRWTLASLVELVRPGTPPRLVSRAAVAAAAGGETVTLTTTVFGAARPPEIITLAAAPTLDAVVASWNNQAQDTLAYRADPLGVASPAGTFLAIRPRRGTGASTRLQLTADPAQLFAAAVPHAAAGRDVRIAAAAAPAQTPAEDLAERLVAEVAGTEALVFADTLFARVAPIAPRLAAAAPFAAIAAGRRVTAGVVRRGVTLPPETVTFAAGAATVAAAVAVWNAQATASFAYRSRADGEEDPAGDRLAIIAIDAAGSDSRITITLDEPALFTNAAPLAVHGAAVTDEGSRELVRLNAARFEAYDGVGRYRLPEDYDPAQPLATPNGLDPRLEPALRWLLSAHDAPMVLLAALPGKLSIPPAAVERLVELLGEDLGDAAFFGELREPATPPLRISRLIDRVRRAARLFADPRVFDDETLDLIRDNAALFGIDDLDRLGLTAVRRVELYRALVEPALTRGEERPPLGGILARHAAGARFAAADLPDLARVLGCDPALVASILASIPAAPNAFQALEDLMVAVVLCRHIGLGGAALGLVTSTNYAQLADLGAAVQSAFRAKYADEATWERTREPFRDALLSRQRDGLVAYLLHSSAHSFDEATDLYHYFLVDTELQGCNRTSRVAAALSSVQLYVQRVQMNLEETPIGHADPVRVPPNLVHAGQWAWRKNYRVWEANRKVFLFPENWIEPEQRDDKTPLFRALEEELMSKPISEQAVREAYARYLRGFDELSRLRIAGSYSERNDTLGRDVLHLFGATSDDPPMYYYRRVDNQDGGVETNASKWSPWERVDLQIPIRTVSPIVHKGQLFVFWVRYVTKSQSDVIDGDSRFVGYSHRAVIEFSMRRLDGTWTPAQPIELTEQPFSQSGSGVVFDPIVPKDALVLDLFMLGEMTLYRNFQPLYDRVAHDRPKDDYALRGFAWDRVYPASGQRISLRGANFQMWSELDLFRRRILERTNFDPGWRGVPWLPPETFQGLLGLILLFVILAKIADKDPEPLDGANEEIRKILAGVRRDFFWSERTGGGRILHRGRLPDDAIPSFDMYSFATLLLERERLNQYKQPLANAGLAEWKAPQWHPSVTATFDPAFTPNQVLALPKDAQLDVVNGAYSDVIIQTASDVFHIAFHSVDNRPFVLRRLSTSVSERLSETLFTDGLDRLLSTTSQLEINEQPHGFGGGGDVADRTMSGKLDLDGPMGGYLREIYFHIPFLLADHLNSQGEHESAQRWYHYIFDPTSSEVISGIDPALPEAERRRKALDRVWRYRGFRNLELATLRGLLENGAAIAAYVNDPFNPHAIARTRITAYQKAILMKYIDNLLDWGDQLFAQAFSQLNTEYLREATLKYVLAQELLGKRPARLGECGEGQLPRKTLDAILAAAINPGGEFLMEVESLVYVLPDATLPAAENITVTSAATGPTARVAPGERKAALDAFVTSALGRPPTEADLAAARAGDPPAGLVAAVASANLTELAGLVADEPRNVTVADPLVSVVGVFTGGFGLALAEQIGPLFCVPDNAVLRAYWDRVESALFKLRNCLDPDGNFRRLPLFAPPIDPGLLVRARAAGLGIEDALGLGGGSLPPFRFRYLIEKARGVVGAVQALGAALLSALEKRDTEALAQLRNTHQKNLLRLTTDIRKHEIRAAEEAVEIVRRRRASADARVKHYKDLVDKGMIPEEQTQVGARITAAILRGADAIMRLVAGIAHIVPEVGSPFSLKYGGKQAGDASMALAQALNASADVATLVADVAGMMGGFSRREQGWRHQQELAEHDVRVLDREAVAADLRLSIAARSLELHELTREQLDEVIDHQTGKVTNLGLYTWLSRTLQRLHREAYGNALAIAQLAEQAYHYELPGDPVLYVGGEWDGARSGLLAGEMLNLALQRMDRRFIERADRQREINQSFSLAQLDPRALIELKETGVCELSIPEFYFDLYYPGHYRRRIRGVRVSIPCITGPYTNVSAKLTLLGSQVRSAPRLGDAYLVDVPLNRTVAVATSTAQGDAGVFELSFRDERYMPFEGAGAVSSWRIELPARFRPFDYQSINDVILNLSYTSDDDASFRADVEDAAAATGNLVDYATNNVQTRVFSLRQEFSSAFNRLVQGGAGTTVTIEVSDRHFPLFLGGRDLAVASTTVVLALNDRDPVGAAAELTVNGVSAVQFPDPTDPAMPGDVLGGLPALPLANAFPNGLKRTHELRLVALGALTPARLRDVLLVVDYNIIP